MHFCEGEMEKAALSPTEFPLAYQPNTQTPQKQKPASCCEYTRRKITSTMGDGFELREVGKLGKVITYFQSTLSQQKTHLQRSFLRICVLLSTHQVGGTLPIRRFLRPWKGCLRLCLRISSDSGCMS